MERFYETVFDTLTGAAVSGAQVFVYDSGGNLASIWQNADGTLVQANPIVTDDNGFFAFYIADGIYTLDFRSGGISLRSIEGIPIFDLADMRADVDNVLARMTTAEGNITTLQTDLATEIVTRGSADLAEATTRAAADAALSGRVTALENANYYSFGAFAPSGIQASEILMDHIVAVDCTLAANFANLQCSVGTPPAATWTADVQRNGVSIGTIAIDNTGAVTKATSGGTAKALTAGQVVTVVGDAAAQAAMARLRFTFRGTR